MPSALRSAVCSRFVPQWLFAICGMVLPLTAPGVGATEFASDAAIRPPLGWVVPSAPDLPPAHPSDADVPRDAWQRLPQPRRQTHSAATTAGSWATAAATEQDCDLDGFAEKSGDDLVAHIRAVTYDCVVRLFADHPDPASERILIAAFQTPNLQHVGRATAQLASAYDGTNSSRLLQLYLYLRASVFFRSYNSEHFDREDEVDTVLALAIDALVANEHYYQFNESREHGRILAEVNTLMGKQELLHRYTQVVRAWLKLWTPRYADYFYYRVSVNTLFRMLYNGHWDPAFLEATTSDLPLMEALRDFALGDWMVGTRAEYMAASAARELGRFLQYDEASIHPTVRAGVKRILDRYESLGFGSSIWLAAAQAANLLDDCDYYAICDFEATLEERILSIEHACGDSIMIRAQRISEQQLSDVCQALARQDAIFHKRLRTHREPVPDDFNAMLEVVVFADASYYDDYSGLFFGNPTNNGGVYLEGDPADPANVARFIAFMRPDLPGNPIWNLEHEHVHYLDGRFNLHGAVNVALDHHVVWWAEGLAEYISKRDDNQAAVDLARTSELPLSRIFEITYRDGWRRVYRWGYLAVRFMFERHEDEVDAFLRFFRAGDYDDYLDYVDAIGERYDDEWRDWLREVEVFEHLGLGNSATTTALTLNLDGANSEVVFSISEWLDIRLHPSTRIAATSLNPQVATATLLQDDQLTITPIALGTALVEVRFSDKWETVTRRFQLTVEECPPSLCRPFFRGWRLWFLTQLAA